MVNCVVSHSNAGEIHPSSIPLPQVNAVNRPDNRKSAYHYICDRLSRIPPGITKNKESLIIPLDDLKLLKEGLADPSPEMVALVKQVLCPAVNEAEIEANLVNPFRENL